MVVLGFITTMSLIFVVVLPRAMNSYRQVNYTASWQESLLAAEMGSDTAMAELRKTLFDPANAFSGWTKLGEDGASLPNQEMRYACPPLIHAGEGNITVNASVSIDSPPELRDGGGGQWFRIRSTGKAFLPGATEVSADKRDSLLRRLSLKWDRKTNTAVSRPHSTRLVELIVRPTGFENAITSDMPIMLNNQKIVVDSYDSRTSTGSTNGLYDPNKFRQNGDVATNSQLIEAGDAHIYGDAFTNAGTIQNDANITGDQRHDFYQELIPVPKPTWTSIPALPNVVSGNQTLFGGPKASPTRYKVSSLTVAGQEQLVFAPSSLGVESYVELWVTGDIKASGSGSIVVKPNANVKIFLEGSVDIKGNGTFNANSQPGRLQILGVNPPTNFSPKMNFSGNGVIVAAIYAPSHDMTFSATGSGGTFWGSLTGRTITMGGTTYIHYDEALADTGHTTDFRIVNWFEDAR